MTPRAQRMAKATTRPLRDQRSPRASGTIGVDGMCIPRAGDHEVEIDGHTIAMTSLDRVLWPESGFTKAEMIAYDIAVAPRMLPFLRDRPLTVGRFPGGVDGRGFAQAEIPGRPSWVRSVELELANGKVRRFTLADDRATLAWLAQMGVVELHTFLGALPDLERPTVMLLDLDPGEPAGLLETAEVALRARAILESAKLSPWAKTSGSLGMHVLAPLDLPLTYAQTRALAEAVARELVAQEPDRVVDRMARSARAGKVLVDVRQNARRLTVIAPYSLRSAPRPTVSMPVSWDAIAEAVAAHDASRLVFEASDVLTCLRPFAAAP